jgi:GR25 family glycosyltransferase involved in LPS biosynthesis
MKEIVVTLSHIKTLYSILKSSNNNDYALVMEDDMALQFDVDFDLLVSKLPKDFGVLQLFVINKDAASYLVKQYQRNLTYQSWKPTYWSAGGYIVNKQVLRKELAPLLSQQGPRLHLDLFAGADRLVPIFLLDIKVKRNCTVRKYHTVQYVRHTHIRFVLKSSSYC